MTVVKRWMAFWCYKPFSDLSAARFSDIYNLIVHNIPVIVSNNGYFTAAIIAKIDTPGVQ